LREKVRIKGRILAPEGPIAGARVTVSPNFEPGTEGFLGQGLSEADGGFEVLLDSSFPGGSLGVFAPGFAIRMMPVPALGRPLSDLVVPVSQEGGNLLLSGRASEITGHVLHAGARLPLFLFTREGRAASGDKELTLSLLEPGEYTFCPEEGGAPGGCVSGFLGADGELRLNASSHAAGAPGVKGAAVPGPGGQR
jgi:hypothetical protein